jgi:acetyl-CoA C-acetyltransferase
VENAAKMAFKMAGIKDPRKEIHVVEPYDPFAYKELHHLEGLQLADKGEAPKRLEEGFWDRDTTTGIPSSPSGGLLGVGNPIAAAGLMKAIEIYRQLSGTAGARQIKRNAQRGMAQAWGDLMQVGTVMIMGVEK